MQNLAAWPSPNPDETAGTGEVPVCGIGGHARAAEVAPGQLSNECKQRSKQPMPQVPIVISVQRFWRRMCSLPPWNVHGFVGLV